MITHHIAINIVHGVDNIADGASCVDECWDGWLDGYNQNVGSHNVSGVEAVLGSSVDVAEQLG